jgi:hypothetical protein
MNPEMFIIPLVMGHVASIIASLKTGYIIYDCCIFAVIYFLYYNVNARNIKTKLLTLLKKPHNKQSVILTATERKRSMKFRAIMHHLAKLNDSIYKIKEVHECDWDDDGKEFETTSEYLVDQSKEFKLTHDIYGIITNNSKEKHRGPIGTEYIEYNTLKIYSYSLSLIEIQDWINSTVKNYKQYLKSASNDHQLYITASSGKKKSAGDSDKNNKNKANSILIEAVPWESTITFENSYFHDIEAVVKKIDFFLNNKAWYLEKGIPYNLGILLYGEPGCGKTRFIKQLMNHTGRHGIDIKLSDTMDFHDLYNIIFKEEINEDYIIPQDQRILIFEDIDAMGEAVKCRDMKAAENTKKKEDEVIKVDAMNVLADLLNNKTSTTKKESLSCESLLYSPLLSSSSSSSNNNNLSYLLNMFDGINECSGRIIIMTSNKPEVLDKALIRPGRIDIKLNFQKCTRYDTMCLINLFWNTHFQEEQLLPDIDMKYTSADIYSIFRSTNDFEDISSLFIL